MKRIADVIILEKAWRNFQEVVSGLPQSETSSILLFHSEEVLEFLSDQRNDLFSVFDIKFIEASTSKVSEIIKSNSVVFDIDDMLKLLKEALAIISIDYIPSGSNYINNIASNANFDKRSINHNILKNSDNFKHYNNSKNPKSSTENS